RCAALVARAQRLLHLRYALGVGRDRLAGGAIEPFLLLAQGPAAGGEVLGRHRLRLRLGDGRRCRAGLCLGGWCRDGTRSRWRRLSSASCTAKLSGAACTLPESGGLGRMSSALQPAAGWSR